QILSLSFVKSKYSPFKVGFTVSKKIGKSVVRSKVKRRLRNAFKEVINLVNENYNYVFIARSGIENANFEDIKNSILILLKKANLIKEKQS
ncbi:MAG: ribonuclease P protein component, partial [Clostridia bacterium]|nr:ribonuclease P protein component [Clostridia bacterium]